MLGLPLWLGLGLVVCSGCCGVLRCVIVLVCVGISILVVLVGCSLVCRDFRVGGVVSVATCWCGGLIVLFSIDYLYVDAVVLFCMV